MDESRVEEGEKVANFELSLKEAILHHNFDTLKLKNFSKLEFKLLVDHFNVSIAYLFVNSYFL